MVRRAILFVLLACLAPRNVLIRSAHASTDDDVDTSDDGGCDSTPSNDETDATDDSDDDDDDSADDDSQESDESDDDAPPARDTGASEPSTHDPVAYESFPDEGGCTTSSPRDPSAGAPAPPPPTRRTGAVKHVFVTSVLVTGNIGGVAGADDLCNTMASRGGLTGDYRAWLSTEVTPAFERIEGVGPWYTTGGVMAFHGRPIPGGGPATELLDEAGAVPSWSGHAEAWAGSDLRGRDFSRDCRGFTSSSSNEHGSTATARANDVEWGGSMRQLSCTDRAALICFEQ